jgi:hypothetical protein
MGPAGQRNRETKEDNNLHYINVWTSPNEAHYLFYNKSGLSDLSEDSFAFFWMPLPWSVLLLSFSISLWSRSKRSFLQATHSWVSLGFFNHSFNLFLLLEDLINLHLRQIILVLFLRQSLPRYHMKASNPWSSHLSYLSAVIIGMHHQTQLQGKLCIEDLTKDVLQLVF